MLIRFVGPRQIKKNIIPHSRKWVLAVTVVSSYSISGSGEESEEVLANQLTSFERCEMCERENLVFDSLIYLESVERF